MSPDVLPSIDFLRTVDRASLLPTADSSSLPNDYHPHHDVSLKSARLYSSIWAIRALNPAPQPERSLPSDVTLTRFTINLPASNGEPERVLNALRYECPSKLKAGQLPPVHVTWHGSGFVFPSLGSNTNFCAYFARETGAVVLDVDYRKAPEHPFPSAPNDALDTCKWVLGQSDKFDLSKFTIGGFSAGANIALSAAWQLGPSIIAAVIAFYPPTQLYLTPAEKIAPEKGKGAIPSALVALFDDCTIIPTPSYPQPTRDPRLSVALAPVDKLPNYVYFNCGTCDTLWNDSFLIWKKIQVLRQIHGVKDDSEAVRRMERVRFDSVPGVGHGYDGGSEDPLVLKQFANVVKFVLMAYEGL